MKQYPWETQSLAKLSVDDREAAIGSAVQAGEAMKRMPVNAEKDREILKAYREGLEGRQTRFAIHEQLKGGTIESRDQQQLDQLRRYAGAMDRALETAATMTPKEIAARAAQERSAASGQWHDISAKESGQAGSKGASKAEFDRWEQQDMAAKAWSRVSGHADTRAKDEFAASLRPVSPRKAVDELDRYTSIAIKQLQAQPDAPGVRSKLQSLESGSARRDASILKRLGSESLSVSITPDQTPLDRVRAIRAAVDQVTALTPKDERFKSAEMAVARTASMPIATTIESTATRLLARSEAVPAANRTMERAR